MKKSKPIAWNNDGWTTIRDADPEKHIVEISCYAQKGTVTEIRKRHNDGEEEKITKAINAEFTLPMPIEEFKKILDENKIDW
ncbi:MAG: hypothetical protein MJ090_05005 [Clostridia bacterium]|nr:hypothetical protein [Clostridia bacterium]